ncbi:MAG: [FeFe] hydrogenase H-cluster maturation GTPase HydF, partial [Muribaculaceae bacterium]|nr:[FeFe] hydrogenase H-cluster maturation GTPase HydF [Muribaculaceae bacterium]
MIDRLNIIVLGGCNSGKSSLINLIAGQKVSLVADHAGTTTDPVRKVMEMPVLGPVMLVDTAGFDDSGVLGEERVSLTEKALEASDIAILLVGENPSAESHWLKILEERKIPVVKVVNKTDTGRDVPAGCIGVSAIKGEGRSAILEALSRALPADFGEPDLLRGLVKAGDNVVLVMPQDPQAPKGRLILPQVQTIRALLDKGCNAVCTTPDRLPGTLRALSSLPDLVITDSQVFRQVKDSLPEECRLTSFSVLMAAFKGDIDYFAESAAAISNLKDGDRILIAEACTHAPQTEDIGRVKIPALLRKKTGANLEIDIV